MPPIIATENKPFTFKMSGVRNTRDLAAEVKRVSNKIRADLRLRGIPLEVIQTPSGDQIIARGFAGVLRIGRSTIDLAPKILREGHGDWHASVLQLLSRAFGTGFAY